MNSTEQKVQIVTIELQGWFSVPDRLQDHYQNRVDKIEQYIEGSGNSRTISLQFKYLQNWYASNFVYNGLVKGETNGYNMSIYGYYRMMIFEVIAKIFPDNPPSLEFEAVVKYFSNCAIQKWHEYAKKLLQLIYQSLNTVSLEGGNNSYTSSWFVLEIAKKTYGTAGDFSKHNYPGNMHIYQKTINDWGTQNFALLDSLISEICDYHIQQANYGGENSLFEFEDLSDQVYAYEILAWLSFREYAGIPNPTSFSHPLMNLPLNKLPETPTPIKENELFNGVMRRLKEEFKGNTERR